jgi:hypothetical protein
MEGRLAMTTEFWAPVLAALPTIGAFLGALAGAVASGAYAYRTVARERRLRRTANRVDAGMKAAQEQSEEIFDRFILESGGPSPHPFPNELFGHLLQAGLGVPPLLEGGSAPPPPEAGPRLVLPSERTDPHLPATRRAQ